MVIDRRQLIMGASSACTFFGLVGSSCTRGSWTDTGSTAGHTDQLSVLPPGAIRLQGYLEECIQLSIQNWSKSRIPYKSLVEFFRTGRPRTTFDGHTTELFAAGEMWGKAVRSTALFYRYTADPKLKQILKSTVADLLTTRRANGSVSCVPVDRQPDGPGGDLWERTYVLLGLDDYYQWVERDEDVLKAMIDEADVTLGQVGPPPKVRIVDLGWSPNHIESSTLLEPIMRLYHRTLYPRYLEFGRYIVETEGGAKYHNVFSEVLAGADPVDVGGIYPKAYEMLSLFEGLVEYYRATGNRQWRQASLNLFRKVIEREITICGNGGGDEPYHPNVLGEAWDNTALEQTNPKIQRMMETCTGVTWMKFCHQILRLTANPIAVDYIELYIYNGLIGAMKPSGDGFSYVNLLNGTKTTEVGWGTDIAGVYVTCCNLNGPEGLAYLPLISVMTDAEGAVINLFNPCTALISVGSGEMAQLVLHSDYPRSGVIEVEVRPPSTRHFVIKLRIPSWSKSTKLKVNGFKVEALPGRFARIERHWSPGDRISLDLDMRCRLLKAPLGLDEMSNQFRALVRGPIVLARDENIDPHYSEPVDIVETNGFVAVGITKPTLPGTTMQFSVPTSSGPIQMVDYASVNNWNGKRIQTWLPLLTRP